MTHAQRRHRRQLRRHALAGMATKDAVVRVALVALFAIPLVGFAARSLLSAAAGGTALLLGGFLVAVALYFWAALWLRQTGAHGAARRKTSAPPIALQEISDEDVRRQSSSVRPCPPQPVIACDRPTHLS